MAARQDGASVGFVLEVLTIVAALLCLLNKSFQACRRRWTPPDAAAWPAQAQELAAAGIHGAARW